MQIKSVLIDHKRLYSMALNEGDEISYGSHKKDTVQVAGFKPHQIRVDYRKKGILLDAKSAYNVFSNNVRTGEFIPLQRPDTFMYFAHVPDDSSETYKLPYNGVVKVGRKTSDNDIVIQLPFISDHHFVFKCNNGNIRIEDAGSTNGIYLNGQKIDKGLMKNGDILTILSVDFELVHGVITFKGTGKNVIIKEHAADSDNLIESEFPKVLSYHKSPRLQEVLPSEPIVLATPPSKAQKYEKTRSMGSVLAGTGAMAMAGMLSGVASPALLAARSASMISPITSFASNRKYNKVRKKQLEEYTRQRLEKYGDYIEDQRVKILDVAAEQERILNNENPKPETLIKDLLVLKRNLWERMPSDRDFLNVRMGMGYDDLCVPVTSRSQQPGFAMENDEVEDLIEQLIEETRIVDNVPMRLDMNNFSTVGMIGDRSKVLSLIRNLLVALTMEHSFEDVRIVCVYDKSEHEFWKYLKWLPHIWAPDGKGRMITMSKDTGNDLLSGLIDMIEQRIQDTREHASKDSSPVTPHYVFIFSSKAMVEKHMIMNYLFDMNPQMGITSLFLFDEIYELPPKCEYIVDLTQDPCAYERSKINERKYFSLDPEVSDDDFNSFVRRMSAVELEGFATQSPIPGSISFLEGYGVETVEDLNIGMRWQMSDPSESLAAPIGRLMGEKTFFLDIHERAHGPHGLAAGTSGSGKSELLQTWILSMACCYHPHDVNFVIVDYKGGGMADMLKPLPHVTGLITNISGDINRPIESLKSEILRRERIFARCGVSNIYKYQKLRSQGKATDILPHLIIVVDEFAELKKDQPDFIKNLISVSAVGRSLGVHLLLATQKPGGVVDESIKANSRFRLCLKVVDTNDSREMIKTPDAASISETGRAIIKVGENELYQTFQSFWSGAPYYGASEDKHLSNQIKLVDLAGQRIDVTERNTAVNADKDELTAIVEHIVKCTEAMGIEPVPGPWLDELPEVMSLDYVASNHRVIKNWLKIPVGIYDIPSNQEQGCQYIDLDGQGNLAVYGAPGTGKTTFLKTLITSMCTCYTPQEAVFYCIDCGGWGLSIFEGMPHCGGIALDCEEEKVSKLKLLLDEEMTRRKKLFVENGVSTLLSYRQEVSDDLPAIILVIDNIVSLFELYQDTIEPFLVKLASQGSTYGLFLVYTSHSQNGVRYKVLQAMKNAVAFEMNDKGDLSMVVGRPDGNAVLSSRGRALIKGAPPVEFQTALCCEGATEKLRNDNLKELIATLDSEWKGERPAPIPVMPGTVEVSYMAERYSEISLIPVGLDINTTAVEYIDLTKHYCFLVTGSSCCGKSKMLEDIYRVITSKFETELFVFDTDSEALHGLKDSASVYVSVNDEPATDAAVVQLKDILSQRMAASKEGKDIGDKELIILIDDIKKFADNLNDESLKTAERFMRLAEGLGVMAFAAGRSDDVTKYCDYEAFTSTFLKHQNGISLSGTPNMNMFFKADLKPGEGGTASAAGCAHLFRDGKMTTVKYMK